jgi:recombination protein RecR
LSAALPGSEIENRESKIKNPVTPALEQLQKLLKQLPGVGYRSAERIALHLLVEKPARLPELVAALEVAAKNVRRCAVCGNLSEEENCPVCADEKRRTGQVCVVENVQDLAAIERSGAYRGRYHVLHGKLSPIRGVAPEDLNLASLLQRVESGEATELILALSNDVEGEATCHYLTERLPKTGVAVTRIGFGLPSGGGVLYADAVTLKSSLESRRSYS